MRRRVPWIAIAIAIALGGMLVVAWRCFDELVARILFVGAVVAAVLAVGGPDGVAFGFRRLKRAAQSKPSQAAAPRARAEFKRAMEIEAKAAEAYISSLIESAGTAPVPCPGLATR